jgi:RecA/RadA recombinase
MAREKKIKKVRAAKAPRVKREKKERKPKQAGNISFFEKLVAATGNELATAASNGIVSGDVAAWIDTGVLLLNGQLSGSLYGGVPSNKICVFAGPEAVGKTFFILSIVKDFLSKDPEAGVVFFESEGAISKQMLEERGIDTKRVFIVPVSTVQEFRTQSLKALAVYKSAPEDSRRPMLFVLDSLGMLSTTKEMEDSEEGKETSDMTRARLIKATFRTITLKLGVLGVPFLVTNHTYDTQGMFSTKVMSGGCLVAGTQIINSNGQFVNIEDLKEGDEIYTLLGNKPITKTFQFTGKDIFRLTLENGDTLECSGEHKFLVNGRWVNTYTLFDLVKLDQNINISDIKTGDICVFTKQVQENLLQDCVSCAVSV